MIFGFFIPAFLQSRKVRKAVTSTHNEIVLLRRKSEKPYDTRAFAKRKGTQVSYQYLRSNMVEARGVCRRRGASLEECRNSPPDCFSVAKQSSAPIPGSTPLSEYKKHLLLQVLSILVEARGVEPLSENLFTQLSTSVVCLWGFPAASRQTGGADRYSLVR